MTDPTSVRLVQARPSQITLLEEDARTNVRRYCAAEIGIVRDRQGLQGMREGTWYGLLKVVVIQMELRESGEGRDRGRDWARERVGGKVAING